MRHDTKRNRRKKVYLHFKPRKRSVAFCAMHASNRFCFRKAHQKHDATRKYLHRTEIAICAVLFRFERNSSRLATSELIADRLLFEHEIEQVFVHTIKENPVRADERSAQHKPKNVYRVHCVEIVHMRAVEVQQPATVHTAHNDQAIY